MNADRLREIRDRAAQDYAARAGYPFWSSHFALVRDLCDALLEQAGAQGSGAVGSEPAASESHGPAAIEGSSGHRVSGDSTGDQARSTWGDPVRDRTPSASR